MNRRHVLGGGIAATVAVFGAAATIGTLPRRDRVKVAFMLGEGANVIDTAGPWEVFQDTMLDGTIGHEHPFELFTEIGRAHV